MINNFKKGLGIFLLISFFVFSPVFSFAKSVLPPSGEAGKIVNPINASSLEGLIQTILIGVLKIGIPIIALAIIYCGFLFVSARGNSEAIGKAKDALLYTVIGAAILLGAWAIALLISNTVLAL
jgi:hypothetical protein